MSYYKTYPFCGAHLDPEEACTCMKKAAPGATNTKSGKAEQFPNLVPLYHTCRKDGSQA